MKFLVDANLPRKFTWFKSDDFSFAHDWGDSFPDKDIWDYALKNDMIILTRNSDYFYGCFKQKRRLRLFTLSFSNKAERKTLRRHTIYDMTVAPKRC